MKEERCDHKIYKYTNKVNGKVYIGRTCTTLKKRARRGQGYKGCVYFWCAIEKYGWDNFEPEILESGLTNEEAAIKETEYIKKFNSANSEFGYNIIENANNDIGEKVRIKMSERNKGENNPRWGCHISEEHRQKIREANKKRVYTPEMIENMRKGHQKKGFVGKNHPMYGRHHTEEAKRKVSEANKGHIPWNKGKKMSEIKPNYIHPLLGKHLSEETKKKVSEANKGKHSPSRKQVLCIETGTIYESATEASKKIGCDVSQLCKCCRGVAKSCKGYHWRYVND